MRKIFVVFILALSLVFVLTSCDRSILSTTRNFDHAIISLPDGAVIEGRVQFWYACGDDGRVRPQIKIDGATYSNAG